MDSYLRVLISSNEKWVVPATPGERRYAVFNVSERHAKDIPYFVALRAEMNGGGLGALLHYLQTFDLSDFDVREVPETTGLAEQKAAGLKGAEAFWFELLESGDLADEGEDYENSFDWGRGHIRVAIDRLHGMYKDWMAEHRNFGHGQTVSKVAFGKVLQRLCRSRKRNSLGKFPNQTPVHSLPDLATCRREFDTAMGSAYPWDPIEDEEDLIG
jgi:hypothetical protein